ncbi:oxidation resistance protein 1 [Marasmius sp. AFHP31]|nr:oxidation resistance protein 1 [Marasmius sp. AFHP31]
MFLHYLDSAGVRKLHLSVSELYDPCGTTCIKRVPPLYHHQHQNELYTNTTSHPRPRLRLKATGEEPQRVNDRQIRYSLLLFSPPTPRASPTREINDADGDSIWKTPAPSRPPPSTQQQHWEPSTPDSEFGAFVSVPASEDPLADVNADFSFGEGQGQSQGGTRIRTCESSTLSFFDQFVKEAKDASERNRKEVLDELFDPLGSSWGASQPQPQQPEHEHEHDPDSWGPPELSESLIDLDHEFFSPSSPSTNDRHYRQSRTVESHTHPSRHQTSPSSIGSLGRSPSHSPTLSMLAPPVTSKAQAQTQDSARLGLSTRSISYQMLLSISAKWMSGSFLPLLLLPLPLSPHKFSLTQNLLYALDQHGISLNALYPNTEAAPSVNVSVGGSGIAIKVGALVVAKDSGHVIFGVFVGDGLHRGKGIMGVGTREFLWKYVKSRDELEVFRWTGKKGYVALCKADCLSFILATDENSCVASTWSWENQQVGSSIIRVYYLDLRQVNGSELYLISEAAFQEACHGNCDTWRMVTVTTVGWMRTVAEEVMKNCKTARSITPPLLRALNPPTAKPSKPSADALCTPGKRPGTPLEKVGGTKTQKIVTNGASRKATNASVSVANASPDPSPPPFSPALPSTVPPRKPPLILADVKHIEEEPDRREAISPTIPKLPLSDPLYQKPSETSGSTKSTTTPIPKLPEPPSTAPLPYQRLVAGSDSNATHLPLSGSKRVAPTMNSLSTSSTSILPAAGAEVSQTLSGHPLAHLLVEPDSDAPPLNPDRSTSGTPMSMSRDIQLITSESTELKYRPNLLAEAELQPHFPLTPSSPFNTEEIKDVKLRLRVLSFTSVSVRLSSSNDWIFEIREIKMRFSPDCGPIQGWDSGSERSATPGNQNAVIHAVKPLFEDLEQSIKRFLKELDNTRDEGTWETTGRGALESFNMGAGIWKQVIVGIMSAETAMLGFVAEKEIGNAATEGGEDLGYEGTRAEGGGAISTYKSYQGQDPAAEGSWV